jgi:hypothetical protein
LRLHLSKGDEYERRAGDDVLKQTHEHDLHENFASRTMQRPYARGQPVAPQE